MFGQCEGSRIDDTGRIKKSLTCIIVTWINDICCNSGGGEKLPSW